MQIKEYRIVHISHISAELFTFPSVSAVANANTLNYVGDHS